MTAEYLQNLSAALRDYGVDKPVAVVDLDRLDANCSLAVSLAAQGLASRLVAKSLPCLPLLDHIRAKVPASGLMTFSEPMLSTLLDAEPDTDHLIGKPLPISSAARVLKKNPTAAERVQWLIDTAENLDAYLGLAQALNLRLRLSLEVDIGLHRGGLRPEDIPQIAQRIGSHPYATLAGVMGYEAHLAKLPHVLKSRAMRSSASAFQRAIVGLPNAGEGLCLNTGGSLTFQSYAAGSAANEVAFGSVLVKPTDFDHPTTAAFQPAAFIASPILKVIQGNALPGLDFLPRWKTDLAIFGGHFLGQPVFPDGFSYSSIFGRSSNQEVWTGPLDSSAIPGDIALLRPTQSEAVLNQFGPLLVLKGGQVVDEWQCLPN
ncbi:alanine racemase [Ruegeria sp. HKCCA5491]|uniref:alanine racemase n=1 Tax=Ruegeria sp. HKCCA5491 TaxID=2682986 RepID=UPI0014887F2F|nr:alanine racemase [Ruegeria sp. HKCCA5491]